VVRHGAKFRLHETGASYLCAGKVAMATRNLRIPTTMERRRNAQRFLGLRSVILGDWTLLSG
jgi:hypothetical protein